MNPITVFLNELQHIDDQTRKGIAWSKKKLSKTVINFVVMALVAVAVFCLIYVALRFILGGFDYYGFERQDCIDRGLVYALELDRCI